MFSFLKNNQSNVINVNDMDDIIEKVELIDIREPYEFQRGSIRTAKNIPMGNLLENPEKYLDKNKTYYIMCQSSGRSGLATNELTRQGFNVINVSGGMGSYVGVNRK